MDRLLQSEKYKIEVCSILIIPMADNTELLQVYSELEKFAYSTKTASRSLCAIGTLTVIYQSATKSSVTEGQVMIFLNGPKT